MNWLKPTHIAYWSIKYQTATDFSFLPSAHENSVRLFGPSNQKKNTNQATNLSVENVVNSILLLSQHNLADWVYVLYTFIYSFAWDVLSMDKYDISSGLKWKPGWSGHLQHCCDWLQNSDKKAKHVWIQQQQQPQQQRNWRSEEACTPQ